MRKPLAIPFAFAFALALCGAAFAQERPEDRANLAELYPDVAAWNADAAKVEAQLKEFAGCRGQLGKSAARLLQCASLESDFSKRFGRLAAYANELLAHDTGEASSMELMQKLSVLETAIGEATAFEAPEILKVGRARIDAFMKQEPKLAIYRHPFDDALRRAPHTLDAKGEQILAAFNLSTGNGATTYNILADADMPWPTANDTGNKGLTAVEMAAGKSRGWTPPGPGKYEIRDQSSPSIRSWIVVEPRAAAVGYPDRKGEFQIDLEPGKYKLRGYHNGEAVGSELEINVAPVPVEQTLKAPLHIAEGAPDAGGGG